MVINIKILFYYYHEIVTVSNQRLEFDIPSPSYSRDILACDNTYSRWRYCSIVRMLFFVPPKVYCIRVRTKNVWLTSEDSTWGTIRGSHDSTRLLGNGISPQTVIMSKRTRTKRSAHVITLPSVWMGFKPPYKHEVWRICTWETLIKNDHHLHVSSRLTTYVLMSYFMCPYGFTNMYPL